MQQSLGKQSSPEIAKRLSFGDMSVSLHSPAKRRQDMEAQVDVKSEMQRVRRILEEITEESNRRAERRTASGSVQAVGEVQLNGLKEQLCKLKFEYIEAETKEQFVQKITEEGDRLLAAAGGGPHCSDNVAGEEQTSLLEHVVEGQKADVKATKAANHDLKRTVAAAVPRLAADIGAVEAERSALTEELASCEAMAAAWEAERAMLDATLRVQETSDLDELFVQQRTRLEQLEAEGSALQEAYLTAEEQQQQARDQLAALAREVQEEEDRACGAQAAAEEASKAHSSRDWAAAMAQLIQELSGVDIEEASSETVRLRLRTRPGLALEKASQGEPSGQLAATVEHLLSISRDPSTGHIATLKLSPANVPTADILARVKHTLDFHVLVREVRQRIMTYALRASFVAAINKTSKYLLEDSQDNLVGAQLPSGATAMIHVPHDWPTSGVSVRLLSVDPPVGTSGIRPDVLNEITAVANESEEAAQGDVMALLTKVETALNQLAFGSGRRA